MTIIGCDLHTRYQVVAWIDEETGEIRSRRLEHENGEARRFMLRVKACRLAESILNRVPDHREILRLEV